MFFCIKSKDEMHLFSSKELNTERDNIHVILLQFQSWVLAWFNFVNKQY